MTEIILYDAFFRLPLHNHCVACDEIGMKIIMLRLIYNKFDWSRCDGKLLSLLCENEEEHLHNGVRFAKKIALNSNREIQYARRELTSQKTMRGSGPLRICCTFHASLTNFWSLCVVARDHSKIFYGARRTLIE